MIELFFYGQFIGRLFSHKRYANAPRVNVNRGSYHQKAVEKELFEKAFPAGLFYSFAPNISVPYLGPTISIAINENLVSTPMETVS